MLFSRIYRATHFEQDENSHDSHVIFVARDVNLPTHTLQVSMMKLPPRVEELIASFKLAKHENQFFLIND